ncbi:SIS domain protein [Bacillus subtilis subsp. subtilis str. RO-NN-1]|uniref:fructosamine deglycase FrlB n=1 Tax=Bacillus subtilis TaxID=1423 RepID=UPI00022BA3AE|nr:fructosamine deglycase FrlB [Bacillus subtilis]AEP92281.1 SIS domain protein [Bacillus subtilis subsp. subtilis str. RO-NN-1]MCY8208797.1 fructosamine deglycase FrlB [Bacillus subtilis]MEC1401995.1 fructosamine deglycase FrlB [Bacillus subtilis]MEC1580952.1 fructosamine deglycase FrlB [Bacillus subtilis]UVZ57220.1 fructosamine deglycase FrlB [Bacillus subtilis]
MSQATAKVNREVQAFLQDLKGKTIDHVFFVACGGSSAIMYPSKYVFDRESKSINSDLYSSNEFIQRNPVQLGEKSLVILCSHSGNTPETVKAAAFARGKGALTIAMTYKPESPLAQEAQYVAQYDWGDEALAINTNYGVLYQIVFGTLQVLENNTKFQQAIEGLDQLQAVYEKALKQEADNAKQFAKAHEKESIIYTMASGANYGVAYSYSICILMEMQWIHSHAIHAGEYFHGPFEIIDESVPFIILLGLDETRPLEERALTFSKKYGKKLTVLDAASYDFTAIDDSVKGYLAPLVLNRVLRSYADELAEARNHPLSHRRYMWKVEY